MTTYNTGNPLGSTDPRDLYDNAQNLDEAVNSDASSFTDRLGKARPTLKGAIDPTGMASSAAASAQQAEAARDAAFVNSDVYPDVATGRAAVADGQQFMVVSSDELIRYRRDTSTTHTEVARYTAQSGISDLEARAASSAGSGAYSNPLWRSPLITENLTDANVYTWTKTRAGNFTRIAPTTIATEARLYRHSTGINVGGYRTRIRHIVNAITVAQNNANSKVGICLDDGVTKTLLLCEADNGVMRKQVVGGASETLATFGDDWANGRTIDMIFDILHDTGEVLISYSVNGGPRYYASFSGLTTRGHTLFLAQNARHTYEHRLEIESMGALARPASKVPALSSLASLLRRKVPAGWNPTSALPADFELYHYNGKFATSYDAISSPLTETDHAAVVYVDAVAGLDTNEGTSSAPLKSLALAVKVARYAKRALVKPKAGDYTTRELSFASARIYSQTFAVVPWGAGRVVSAPIYADLAWSLNTGATWQTTLTLSAEGAISVFDAANLTASGDHSPLVSLGSIELVDANPGSYYLTGSTLYVRTLDGREPDASLRVYDTYLGSLSYNVNGGTLYAERLDVMGSSAAFYSSQASPYTGGSTILLNDVKGLYNKANGVWAYGSGLCVTINSTFYGNLKDGLSYGSFPAQGGLPNVMIEVGVTSRDNGAGGSDQASTTHSGATACRVNGTYKAKGGQGVADVNSAWSWFLGCTAQGGSVTNEAFRAGNESTDAGKIWLDNCTAIGSTTAIALETASTAYINNFNAGGGALVGNVQTYEP